MRSLTLVIVGALMACAADPSSDTTESAGTGDASGDASGTEAGTDDATGGTDTGGADVDACDGAVLVDRPVDPAERGPWAVGARTTQIGDVTLEVWYPAAFGSDEGATAKSYDANEQLPASQQTVIPPDDLPIQDCDCYEDLPIDENHGPYPVVLFIHGTAGFRTQSLPQMTHWASRGFVVVAGDYPGLKLADMLALLCPDDGGTRDLSGDTDAILAALAAASGDLAFLDGRLQLDRVAVAGHSAGGSAAASSADKAGVRVVIPMAGGGDVAAAANLETSLHLAGTSDMVVSYGSSTGAYDSSVAPKQFVGLENAGHLAFSYLCSMKNGEGQDIVEIGQEHGVCGVALAGPLWDCSDTYLPDPIGWEIINYATTAVLEEYLHCRPDPVDLSAIGDVYPDVSEYRGEQRLRPSYSAAASSSEGVPR